MKKLSGFHAICCFCCLIIFTSNTNAQSRWQQRVDYDIKVTLNDADNSLTGNESFVYTNNSPDTLRFIWIHCWPNAYKDTGTALYRQLVKLEERRTKLQQIKDRGFIDHLDFTADGTPATTTPHPKYSDILRLDLPAPLPPGQHTRIATPFHIKIPTYFSRMGHQNRFYMITQWYPKPAVYDLGGWHEMPYLDQGEFYSEYGSFDVHITLPSNYVVGATGTLLDTAELSAYRSLGKANLNNPTAPRHYKPNSEFIIHNSRFLPKTLNYHADSVHDFAWFANPDLYINYDTLRLPSGRIIDAFSYFRPDGNKEWRNSISFIKDAVLHYSQWIGEYAYPSVSAIEGPGNTSSGGMEYPMITLITSPKATREELDGVIAHEVGHNWFYGMLGSNERDNPWMDEGINTYYEFRYEAEKYRGNTMLGSMIPKYLKRLTAAEFLDNLYAVIGQVKAPEPIATPAADFPSEFDYGLVVYARTAVWLHLVEKEMGFPDFEKGMHAYFAAWKFKHPSPEDLQASLESISHTSLAKLFNLLHTHDLL